tara:strand:- start:76 stop:732 length:657 start_codon:yes stop_codon:yes gene_type:complete
MPIQRFVVGPMANNCYILFSEGSNDAAIVDPGMGSEVLDQWISQKELQIKYVLNTHGHADHVFNNSFFVQKRDEVLGIGFEDIPLLEQLESSGGWMGAQPEASPVPSIDLKDGLELQIGSEMISILATPGHTPGSTCFVFEDSVLTGDTLFAGSIGRFDFPGGSLPDLVASIKEKIFVLEPDVVVLPGHNDLSTVEKEKKDNPFVGSNSTIDLSSLEN